MGIALHGYIIQMLWDIYNHDKRVAHPNDEAQKANESEQDESQSETGSVIINEEEQTPSEEQTNENKNTNNDKNITKNDNGDDAKSENFADQSDIAAVLKPNMSEEVEDQWDIVKFFDNHPKWPSFHQILIDIIETQSKGNAHILSQENISTELQAEPPIGDRIVQSVNLEQNQEGTDDNDSSDSDVISLLYVRISMKQIQVSN
ncbi:hypothetical protein RFI_06920 [Reticulomyxa filosa]|uniref:Uncharacterized protein n=1 Tax=Reticulomyxa filosa TaxID=46433 RepID=X6NWJ3_RETFI|nr:hypothetical protein RFI_06920 [Reticulomyxa filosa]|eukprot:ETO30199.1 hypothetical protein RFI_06920 [Reticulomyxa filosa]